MTDASCNRSFRLRNSMRNLVLATLIVPLLLVSSGCAPVLVAGGAAAGYYVGKDERPVKVIMNDSSITAAINAKYVADDKVSALNINVDTRNGVVTLYGSVPSLAVEDQAILLASQAKGVKRIVSRLTIIEQQQN